MKTCTQVYFTRESRVGSNDMSELCGLREIHFSGCNDMEMDDFRTATIQSLRDIRAWETIERVVLEDCCLLEYDKISEIVGKDRLHNSVGHSLL